MMRTRTARLGLLVALIALLPATGLADSGTKLSIGALGGATFPIVQDDVGDGSRWGVRARLGILEWMGVDVAYYSSKLGETIVTVGNKDIQYDGGTLSQISGAVYFDAWTTLFILRPYIGLGAFSLDLDQSQKIDNLGYLLGLEFGFDLGASVELQVGGRSDVMTLSGGGSRKFASVYAGLSYMFLK